MLTWRFWLKPWGDIEIRHHGRHQVKKNMFKACSWEEVRAPHPPHGVVMEEGILKRNVLVRLIAMLWDPVPPPKRKQWEMLSLTLKQVEGHWVHSVSSMPVPKNWVDKCLTYTWGNTELAFCSGGGSEEWVLLPGHVLPEFVGAKGAWASPGPCAATPEKGLAF